MISVEAIRCFIGSECWSCMFGCFHFHLQETLGHKTFWLYKMFKLDSTQAGVVMFLYSTKYTTVVWGVFKLYFRCLAV